MEVRENTWSVCPACLKMLPAVRKTYPNGAVYLEKECPEHGLREEILWSGYLNHAEWTGMEAGGCCSGSDCGSDNSDCDCGCGCDCEKKVPDCGHCTDLCSEHERDTCCTLLEVTDRCNLHCRFCFADPDGAKDPALEQVKVWVKDLTVPGKTFLQFSGGEPTVREDLPDIIAYARAQGCKYIQVNSNGIRLAEEPEYVKKLAEAGLDFVFLQFDGVTADVYETLRGKDLFEIKKKAIENCGKEGIGVTLVPTVVPGVNDHQVGDILRFAVKNSPVVRGVHYQPVSYFGRLPKIPMESDRYTLDRLLADLEKQSEGLVQLKNIAPSCCDHPMCGFHGDFVVLPEGGLYPLSSRKKQTSCCGTPVDAAEANREFIGRRWTRSEEQESTGPIDMTDLDTFLSRVRSHGFTITSMAFQDAGNLDYERLRRCSLHVYRNGRKTPFCVAYLSAWD